MSNWTESASGVPMTYTFVVSMSNSSMQVRVVSWEDGTWHEALHETLVEAFEKFVTDALAEDPNCNAVLSRVYDLQSKHQFPVSQPSPEPEPEET